MIELIKITIENFGTIERVELKLNQPGFVLITGRNKDAPAGFESNGAGKSLLFDAICWCLWDETARGESGDAVVRRRVGKDCCVKLELREDKTTYLVSRHRKDSRIDKPNDLRLFVNGVEKTKKMKSLQEVINQIVGFDFTTFCAMMPGAGVNVATLTDTKIKELLEKLLQTEQLSSAYKKALARLNELDSNLAQNSAKCVTLKSNLVTLEKEVGQLRTLEESFEQKKADNVSILIAKIKECEENIALAQVEIDKAPGLRAAAVAIQQERDELAKQVVAIEKPAKLQVAQLREQAKTYDTLAQSSNTARIIVEQRISKIEKLEGTCPTCEGIITPEHQTEALTLLRAEASKHSADYFKLREVETDILKNANQTINEAASEVAILTGQMDMKDMAIKGLINAANEAARQVKFRDMYRMNLDRENIALVKAQTESHNFKDIFADKAKKVVEIVNNLSSLLAEYTTLSREQKLCTFWVEGFSPAGLRSYMLDYVTPVLNDRAAYYAQVLTGSEMKVSFSTKTALKKGGDKDKFQIIVEQKHGGDAYKSTSKGEKARADLVIAMALGDLATFRTAKQLPWRFLDEPFESIDDAGNEAVMALLNDQKDRFKTVFVVTHKPAFKKLFQQRIVMIKENGVSRLEKDSSNT